MSAFLSAVTNIGLNRNNLGPLPSVLHQLDKLNHRRESDHSSKPVSLASVASVVNTFKKRMDALEEDDVFEDGDEEFDIDVDKLIGEIDVDIIPSEWNDYQSVLREVAGVDDFEDIENADEVMQVGSYQSRLRKGCLSNYEDMEGYPSSIEKYRTKIPEPKITLRRIDSLQNKPLRRLSVSEREKKTCKPISKKTTERGVLNSNRKKRNVENTQREYKTIKTVRCDQDQRTESDSEPDNEDQNLVSVNVTQEFGSGMRDDVPLRFSSRVIKTKNTASFEDKSEKDRFGKGQYLAEPNNIRSSSPSCGYSTNLNSQSFVDNYIELNQALTRACSASERILQELKHNQVNSGRSDIPRSRRSSVVEKVDQPLQEKENNISLSSRPRSNSQTEPEFLESYSPKPTSLTTPRVSKSQTGPTTKPFDVLKSDTQEENFRPNLSHIHPCIVSNQFDSSRNLSVAEEMHPSRIYGLSDRDQLCNILRKADQAFKRSRTRVVDPSDLNETSKYLEKMEDRMKKIHGYFSSIQQLNELPLKSLSRDDRVVDKITSNSIDRTNNGRFLGNFAYPSSMDAYKRNTPCPPKPLKKTELKPKGSDELTSECYRKFIESTRVQKQKRSDSTTQEQVIKTPVEILNQRITNEDEKSQNVVTLNENDKRAVLNFIRSKRKTD